MQRSVKQGGFLTAVLIAVAMAVVAYFTHVSDRLHGEMGICFPSSNNWEILSGWAWAINLTLILACTLFIAALNRRYNYIPNSDLLAPALFPVLTCSFPWICKTFCSSTILLAVNLACLAILFSSYKKRNTTQETFLVGSLLSIGSTFQYAFIFYMPLYLIAGFLIKSSGLKNVLAFLIGVAAPYWCLLGTGIVSPADFRIPLPSNIFSGFAPMSEMMILVVACFATAVAWFVMMCNNSIKLLKANSNVRQFNFLINILGGGTLIFMIADFTNLLAYITTFMFCVAVQVSLAVGSGRDRLGMPVLLSVSTLYAAFFAYIVIIY